MCVTPSSLSIGFSGSIHWLVGCLAAAFWPIWHVVSLQHKWGDTKKVLNSFFVLWCLKEDLRIHNCCTHVYTQTHTLCLHHNLTVIHDCNVKFLVCLGYLNVSFRNMCILSNDTFRKTYSRFWTDFKSLIFLCSFNYFLQRLLGEIAGFWLNPDVRQKVCVCWTLY